MCASSMPASKSSSTGPAEEPSGFSSWTGVSAPARPRRSPGAEREDRKADALLLAVAGHGHVAGGGQARAGGLGLLPTDVGALRAGPHGAVARVLALPPIAECPVGRQRRVDPAATPRSTRERAAGLLRPGGQEAQPVVRGGAGFGGPHHQLLVGVAGAG